MRYFIFKFIIVLTLVSCRKQTIDPNHPIMIDSVFVNSIYTSGSGTIKDIDYENVVIRIVFSEIVDTTLFNSERIGLFGPTEVTSSYKFSSKSKQLIITPNSPFSPLSSYRLIIDQGNNLGGLFPEAYSFPFRTRLDSTPKFPLISDDSLLTLIQKKTFEYFWDYGHPVSGLARERYGSGETVTSGGSGFGVMSVLAAINNRFITREEGFERLSKIVTFLQRPETDKFHGAFPHWLNGTSGKVIPFSSKDNGGDLVETAYLMQGLLTVREYFRNGNAEEKALCNTITSLWEAVEWSWYRRDNQNLLYWHWSPTLDWAMNMGISGWNEALIVYVLASSSPTYPIPQGVYSQGWARNGAYPMKNNKTFYGISLPLGENYGGPLFFAHYSFLGLDPRNLSDQYASYWTQNVAHSEINYTYCKTNPKNYSGYSESCWGLTASDTQSGYSASSPTNDLGVIAPTAALSSFPYTPVESMKAMKFFYYTLGDKIFGTYGFNDSFNLTTAWFADSYLAIDQGPIICMIENHKTGLLWDLFMSNPEIKTGLTNLGFTY